MIWQTSLLSVAYLYTTYGSLNKFNLLWLCMSTNISLKLGLGARHIVHSPLPTSHPTHIWSKYCVAPEVLDTLPPIIPPHTPLPILSKLPFNCENPAITLISSHLASPKQCASSPPNPPITAPAAFSTLRVTPPDTRLIHTTQMSSVCHEAPPPLTTTVIAPRA